MMMKNDLPKHQLSTTNDKENDKTEDLIEISKPSTTALVPIVETRAP